MGAGEVTIRVLSSYDKVTEVKPLMMSRYVGSLGQVVATILYLCSVNSWDYLTGAWSDQNIQFIDDTKCRQCKYKLLLGFPIHKMCLCTNIFFWKVSIGWVKQCSCQKMDCLW